MAKRLSPKEKLIKAEENYLLALGWQQIKNKKGGPSFWSPETRVGYVFPGDMVYRDSALDAQKQESEFPVR